MTFEGPDNEEDVESQINTIDAVIAENPDVLCISASDMDSCQDSLKLRKRMKFRLLHLTPMYLRRNW